MFFLCSCQIPRFSDLFFTVSFNSQHVKAQFFLIESLCFVKVGNQLPLVHDTNHIGKFQKFIQVCRDQKDGAPCVSQLYKLLMDDICCADIHSPGRLFCDQDLRIVSALPGYDYLLYISSGKHRNRSCIPITPDLILTDILFGKGMDRILFQNSSM